MDEKMIQIDVESIMENIRQNIKERGYEKSDLKFADIEVRNREGIELLDQDFEIDKFSQVIVKMDGKRNVQCWRQLTGNKLKVMVQKVVRKCIKFYVEPIVEEQDEFNQHTVSAMAMVFSKFNEMQEKRIEELEKQVETLEKRCQKLENVCKEK